MISEAHRPGATGFADLRVFVPVAPAPVEEYPTLPDMPQATGREIRLAFRNKHD